MIDIILTIPDEKTLNQPLLLRFNGKICTRCRFIKSFTQFYKANRPRNAYLRSECKECSKKIMHNRRSKKEVSDLDNSSWNLLKSLNQKLDSLSESRELTREEIVDKVDVIIGKLGAITSDPRYNPNKIDNLKNKAFRIIGIT